MFRIIKEINRTKFSIINKCQTPILDTYYIHFRNSSDGDRNHPIRRTLRILRNDMRKIKNFILPKKQTKIVDGEPMKRIDLDNEWSDDFQTHCDVLIIGNGALGSATAYWLTQKARKGLSVVVLEHKEKTPVSLLPLGGLTQQFQLPENVEMSVFGAEFIRNTMENLGNVNVNYNPCGTLLLSKEGSANKLKQMSNMHNELGARTEILSPDRLKSKFPWLKTNDIELGCYGLERMGWFDPWPLLMALKYKAREYGTHFVKAELTDFEFQLQPDITIEGGSQEETYNSLDKAVVKMPNGETRTIKFALCVIAADNDSAEIARLAKIGSGSGILAIPLPITDREYCDYIIEINSINAPGLCTPYTIFSDGTYFRNNGLSGSYVAGYSLPIRNKNVGSETDPKEETIRSRLTENVNAFDSAKLCNTFVSRHDHNYFDGNGILGSHAYYNNLYIAAGFSAQGIQQAPAVGRAISELIIDGQFRTLDLTRLGFDRIVVDRPLPETNVF